uniref:Uncharacterized protein n=1 Tax=Arundo donax TaxID=35708 RepID=A0A0A9HD72_ARUDO
MFEDISSIYRLEKGQIFSTQVMLNVDAQNEMCAMKRRARNGMTKNISNCFVLKKNISNYQNYLHAMVHGHAKPDLLRIQREEEETEE